MKLLLKHRIIIGTMIINILQVITKGGEEGEEKEEQNGGLPPLQ